MKEEEIKKQITEILRTDIHSQQQEDKPTEYFEDGLGANQYFIEQQEDKEKI